MTLARNILWTSQVDVDGITMRFDEFRGLEQLIHIVRTELYNERPVLRAAFLAIRDVEVLVPIALSSFFGGEHLYQKKSEGIRPGI